MSTGGPPLAFIRGAERYITGQIAMRVTTRHEAASTQLRNLLECIRTAPHISQAEGAEVLEHLQVDNGTFDADQRSDLAVAVTRRQTTLQDVDTNSSIGTQSQVHMYTHAYYPDWLWRILLSDDTMGNKLIHVGEFWVNNLGLFYPDEATKRLGVATVQVASGAAVDADLGYNQLHDLQGIVARKRGTTGLSIRRFPADPNTFWHQYPTAYTADHPPAPCRIDATMLAHRNTKEAIPARCTNKRCTVVKPRSQKAASQPTPACNESSESKDLLRMMMSFMMGNTGGGGMVELQSRLSSSRPVPMWDRQREPLSSRQSASASVHDDDASGVQVRLSGDAAVDNAAPVNIPAPPIAILDTPCKPANVGGLPSVVLDAPPQTSSAKMAQIRADIAAAVKRQREATVDDDGADAPCDATAVACKSVMPVARFRLWGKGPMHRRPRVKPLVLRNRPAASRKKLNWATDPALRLLMRKVPAKDRPPYSETPTKYSGGRIHFDPKRSRFRVYIKTSDKIEQSVRYDDAIVGNKEQAFQFACGLIENGGVP